MPKQFKLEQSTQMGQKVVGVTITGDKRNNEPETFRIHFPFGDVEVTRATDGKDAVETDYWVHIYVNNPTSPNYCPDGDSGAFDYAGTIKAARLDQTDKHATESNLGDFERKELYHLAVRVGCRMKMTIIEHWPADTRLNGTPIPPRVKPPCTFEQSGWQSVKEMQKDLIKRFPQDGPKRITNGIMYTTLSYGRTMFVTLHD